MAPVLVLVPFLLAGCASPEQARQIFQAAAQVCRIVEGTGHCDQR
ncbi:MULTISPECIES: hypothetical protein [Cronobacter]|nr:MULTISPECIES: hypothetical protein [Cronobacter]MDK1236477.1 hypothetical protein [Cronobacter turicensis]